MSEHWRAEQLEAWERSRRTEVHMDVMAHWLRCLPTLVVAAGAFCAVDYLRLPWSGPLKFGIGLLVGIFLTGRVILWLRVWGAYIERRLTEIEALVSNERPEYYTHSSNLASFDDNPLFARLEALQVSVDRLAVNPKK